MLPIRSAGILERVQAKATHWPSTASSDWRSASPSAGLGPPPGGRPLPRVRFCPRTRFCRCRAHPAPRRGCASGGRAPLVGSPGPAPPSHYSRGSRSTAVLPSAREKAPTASQPRSPSALRAWTAAEAPGRVGGRLEAAGKLEDQVLPGGHSPILVRGVRRTNVVWTSVVRARSGPGSMATGTTHATATRPAGSCRPGET